MEAFLARRFGIWFVPFVVVYITLTLLLGVVGQLLGLVFLSGWTLGLVQLERMFPRFRYWMNSDWGS